MAIMNDGKGDPPDSVGEALSAQATKPAPRAPSAGRRRTSALLDAPRSAEGKYPPEDRPRRPTEPKPRRRKLASGVVVEEEGPSELSVAPVSPLKLLRRRKGFSYRWASPKNLTKYTGQRGWVVCDHPEVLAQFRDGLDPAQQGSAKTTRDQVLLCRPFEVTAKVNALKAREVDKTEQRTAAKFQDNAAKIRREAGIPERIAPTHRPDFDGVQRHLVGG